VPVLNECGPYPDRLRERLMMHNAHDEQKKPH
jgi:hypothetical protein